MKNPDLAPYRQGERLDFAPVLYGKDGKRRRPKKGEIYKRMEKRDFTINEEPPFWLLEAYFPMRTVIGWYLYSRFWRIYTNISYFFGSRLDVTVSHWMVHCSPEGTHIMPERVVELEGRAANWRRIAAILGILLLLALLIR